MLSNQHSRLKDYSDELISKLSYIHENFYEGIFYPRSSEYKSAIFDGSYKEIYSNLEDKRVDLNKNIYVVDDKIHYVRVLERYYLGAMFLVIEIDDSKKWFSFFRVKVIFYGVMLFLFLLFIGYFLLKILLSPMRESIYLLDRFIKDTTHELNTPVNAILINIETIPRDKLDEKTAKKIHRIDIAARTISNIYNDLTYMALKNRVASEDENVDLYKLINERAEYFKIISSQKRIQCNLNLKEAVTLFIDRGKISRVIDNLISNAIKYNKRDGEIKITLNDNYFEIEDSGVGMSKDEIKEIFQRYTRFNKSVGGFGIGLNIVAQIINEYDLDIEVDSKVDIGTKVRVSW
jgi:two-component system OmpR family sensor kinase